MSLAGDPLVAADPGSDIQNTAGTTASTTYTATLTGGTACGFAFIAPNSGKGWVHLAANMFNSGAFHNLMSFRIRTGGVVGSGSDVVAVSDTNGITAAGTAGPADRHGVTFLVVGLTPGSTYNIQTLHRVDGGAGGTFGNKFLGWDPVA